MNSQDARQAHVSSLDEDATPAGTAIVRPLRHVKAVRERHAEELAARSIGAESRSARAWNWALGDTDVAPVTDRLTRVPPSRGDIEAEIAKAEERRLRGDRDNRADGAAAVLRWLIGDDDHLPVRGANRGELVDGFGEVVRSPSEIADLITRLSSSVHQISGSGVPDRSDRQDWRSGAIATLTWTLDRSASFPISGALVARLTTRDLKTERLHAADVVERRVADGIPSGDYGLGVRYAIDWLLGDVKAVCLRDNWRDPR